MHILNQKKTRNISGIAFQFWPLQVFWFSQLKIFSSTLFDLRAFPMSEYFLDANESV